MAGSSLSRQAGRGRSRLPADRSAGETQRSLVRDSTACRRWVIIKRRGGGLRNRVTCHRARCATICRAAGPDGDFVRVPGSTFEREQVHVIPRRPGPAPSTALARLGVLEPVVLHLHRQPGQALTGFAKGVVERAEPVEGAPGVTGDRLDELLCGPPWRPLPASPLHFEEQVCQPTGVIRPHVSTPSDCMARST